MTIERRRPTGQLDDRIFWIFALGYFIFSVAQAFSGKVPLEPGHIIACVGIPISILGIIEGL
ncbi:MAG: hypothetical protein HY507_01045 [Candidatus Zambryskibacteria bacterium]|nr:hypothetical protein [Candidatus Zambryskibacteria bacterium]